MAKITNQELMAALTSIEDLMTERFNELTEKLDTLTSKVEEMAARRSPGRRRDSRRFRCTDTEPPGRDTSIDKVIWRNLKELTAFSREEMIARVHELIEDGKLKTKRSAKDLVSGTIPWALREGYIEVVPASEKVPVIDAVSVIDAEPQAAE